MEMCLSSSSSQNLPLASPWVRNCDIINLVISDERPASILPLQRVFENNKIPHLFSATRILRHHFSSRSGCYISVVFLTKVYTHFIERST